MEYVVDNGFGIFQREPERIAAQLSAWFSTERAALDAIARRCAEVRRPARGCAARAACAACLSLVVCWWRRARAAGCGRRRARRARCLRRARPGARSMAGRGRAGGSGRSGSHRRAKLLTHNAGCLPACASSLHGAQAHSGSAAQCALHPAGSPGDREVVAGKGVAGPQPKGRAKSLSQACARGAEARARGGGAQAGRPFQFALFRIVADLAEMAEAPRLRVPAAPRSAACQAA